MELSLVDGGMESWPALATGCTVVLKPAEEDAAIRATARRADLGGGNSSGLVNIVTGFGETAGAALAVHPGIDKVAFTWLNRGRQAHPTGRCQ